MLRLTLRTLLAYLDDTLPPAEAKAIGQKLAESPQALELMDRIKKVTRKRGLSTPPGGPDGGPADPNTVAAYLSDTLTAEQVTQFETLALESDVHLADVAACHQILTLLLSEQMRVPPTAYRRMYTLVKGKEAIPGRTPGGRALPVGGVVAAEKAADAADADAQYLLGMTPYSQTQSVGQRAARWAVAALLAVGFVVTAWLAWPKGPIAPVGGPLAKGPVVTIPTAAPEPEKKEPEKKEPDKEPEKKAEPETKPEKKAEPETKPAGDLVPAPEPPRPDRLAVAKLDSPDEKVLLARKSDTDPWVRLVKGEGVNSTDRVVCPPGFTAKMTFSSGATAELWGNVVPDLLPLPLLDTAVTLHAPNDGYDADFTLHAGRVYLTAGKPTGAVFRVRFRGEVWDVSLPDAASEVMVQLVHQPTPGKFLEAPVASAAVYAVKGTAGVKERYKAVPKIAAGEVLLWDSKGGKMAGPKKPDPADRLMQNELGFAKAPVYPNAKSAQPMLKALDGFAARLKDAKSVTAALAELRAEPNAPPTAEYFAGGRFSVLAAAGLLDLPAIADALNDTTRQDLRAAAVHALQYTLAANPDQEDRFRELAATKLRLTDKKIRQLLRTLRGVSEAERTDRVTLDELVAQLGGDEVAEREVALFTLLYWVEDPSTPPKPGLIFDTAGTAEVRAAGVKAWEARVKELTNGK